MTAKYWLGYPVGALALASAISLPSQAEETTTEDDTLNTVTIFGESYRSTGTKSELQPMEAPMSFERVDAEDLEQQQVNSVDDSLRYTSGTSPENRGGAITIFDQYTLRGFSTYNNYYNGLPLQYNTAGNLAPQVDAFATEGIEILKGPSSVLYGASSAGGMINQIAKQPQYDRNTAVQLTAGSNSLLEAGVDSTGHLTDSLDYRFIALGRSRDGQQDGTEEERLVIAPSATWYVGDHTSLNLNAYYQDDPKAIPSTPMPAEGTLNEASYGYLDADTYVGDHNWGNVDKTVTMLGYKLNHDFSDDLSFLQNFRYTHGELLQKNSYFRAGYLSGTTLNRNFYLTDEELDSFVVDNQLAYRFNIGSLENNALFGLEYHYVDFQWEYGDDFAQASGSAIDLASINNEQINPDDLNLDNYSEDKDIIESQIGVYLQDEISYGNSTLLAALRYDAYNAVTKTDVFSALYPSYNGSTEVETNLSNLSTRLAAIHQFDNGLSPYLSYSDSFQPIAGTDFEGNAFEATTSYQFESGLKFTPSDRAEITAAAFFISQQNVKTAKDGDPNVAQGYTQTGEIQSKGIELSAKLQPLTNLALRTNLTLLDAEIVENEGLYEGNTPHLVAEQTANLWADYRVFAPLTVSGGIRYVGEMQAGLDNSETVPAYTLVDMSSRYDFSQAYSLGLTVSNLLNEEYLSCGYGENGSPFPSCWYGSPRNVELSFTAHF